MMIIVGIDGSRNSEHAVDFACAEAGLWGASLLLVHSWDFPYGDGVGPMPDVIPKITSAAHRLVEWAAARARIRCGPAIEVDTLVTQGNAAGTLLHQARAPHPGRCMIVVGSRGRGGFASLLLGSVSHQVVHHATVPVAVVPAIDPESEVRPITRLVVGIDGSAQALSAARWAAAHAGRAGTDILLANVVQVPKLINPLSLLTPPDAAAQLAALGQQWCNDARAAVGEVAPDCVVQHRVNQGVPATELLAVTGPGDLLVIGAVGAGGAARAVMGRVTEHVLHRSQTPVVVVP